MASPEKNHWRKGWNITDEKRNWYRSKSKDSAERKRLAEKHLVSVHESELRVPRQKNDDLMPVCTSASVDKPLSECVSFLHRSDCREVASDLFPRALRVKSYCF